MNDSPIIRLDEYRRRRAAIEREFPINVDGYRLPSWSPSPERLGPRWGEYVIAGVVFAWLGVLALFLGAGIRLLIGWLHHASA